MQCDSWHQRWHRHKSKKSTKMDLTGKSSTWIRVVIIFPQNCYLISSSHGHTFTIRRDKQGNQLFQFFRLFVFTPFLFESTQTFKAFGKRIIKIMESKNQNDFGGLKWEIHEEKIFFERYTWRRKNIKKTVLGYKVKKLFNQTIPLNSLYIV